MNRQIGEPLLIRGDLIRDARHGETEIINVTSKYVWYKNDEGTYRTSKRRALAMFEKGTAFPPLPNNDTPRWESYLND